MTLSIYVNYLDPVTKYLESILDMMKQVFIQKIVQTTTVNEIMIILKSDSSETFKTGSDLLKQKERINIKSFETLETLESKAEHKSEQPSADLNLH